MHGIAKWSLGQWMLVSLALMAPGIASAVDPVSSQMEAFRVVRAADGKEKLEAAKDVKPGEVIEYQITYTNADANPVSDLQVNVAVPAGTEYVEGSVKTAVKTTVHFSADSGKKFAEAPLKRPTADGKGEETVPATSYSNIRWLSNEPLKKEGAQKYSYRVRVSDTQ